MKKTKKQWTTPEIRSYGTFEGMTRGCDKMYGMDDGYTFVGQVVVCAS